MEALIACVFFFTIAGLLSYLTYKANSNAHQNKVLRRQIAQSLKIIEDLNRKLNHNGKEETKSDQEGEAE